MGVLRLICLLVTYIACSSTMAFEDRPPVMGRLPFDPMDWSKKRPEAWVTEMRPTAHFKKVGVVSQSVGYAHVTFKMNLKPLQQEMTELCQILTKMVEKSMDYPRLHEPLRSL